MAVPVAGPPLLGRILTQAALLASVSLAASIAPVINAATQDWTRV